MAVLEPTKASPPNGPVPVAEWNFSGDDPYASTGSQHRLVDGPGSRTRLIPTASGAAMRFDGRSDHLVVPCDRLGGLDVGRSGDCVSVFALVRRRGPGTGFIAGMWQEDDGDPQRQYGLFVDLPTYGGADQVAGHVSADGSPSPGLPYSRDYSATARRVPYSDWRVVGFTYDGHHARSFLDGLPDGRDTYTEPEAPVGAGLTYGKNPYYYPSGLKRSSTSPFTVGAVTLTGGLGNFFCGDIARLAVWDVTLSNREALSVAAAWTAPGAPLAQFDFSVTPDDRGQVDGHDEVTLCPLSSAGWTQERIVRPADTELQVGPGFAICSSSTGAYLCRDGAPAPHPPGVAIFPLDVSLCLTDVGRASYKDLSSGASETTEVAVKVHGRWFTTATAIRDQLEGAERVTAVFSDINWKDAITGAEASFAYSTTLQAIGVVARGDHQVALRVTDLRLYPPMKQVHRSTMTQRPPREMEQSRTGTVHDTAQERIASA